MDLLFLGTSAGTPTRARNVTALALIEDIGKTWYLVDCGEGTQHQLLRASLSLHDLQTLFITHVHGDHCYGLPGLLATAGMQGRTRPLSIVAPAGIEQWLDVTARMSELTLPFELRFVASESLGVLSTGNWLVDATLLSHRVPSYAYGFSEIQPFSQLDLNKLAADDIDRGPIWGKLKHGIDALYRGRILRSRDYLRYPYPPRRIVVGGDNDDPTLLSAACRRAQVLVHEATYTEEVGERLGRFGHSSAAQVATFAQERGLANLVLTHFSPRYQPDLSRMPSIEDIRREAAGLYHGALFLAEDFARFRLNRNGKLERLPAPDKARR